MTDMIERGREALLKTCHVQMNRPGSPADGAHIALGNPDEGVRAALLAALDSDDFYSWLMETVSNDEGAMTRAAHALRAKLAQGET